MGLDMYLYARRPNTDEANQPTEVAYWRKANAIHRWFVMNVQGGEDKCRPHEASRAQLEALVLLCQRVKGNLGLARELLPTQSGFFFGRTEYDDWYLDTLGQTIRQVSAALEDRANESFFYRSSW